MYTILLLIDNRKMIVFIVTKYKLQNKETICHSTVPNVKANFAWGDVQHRCEFMSGDWAVVSNKLNHKLFGNFCK